MFQLENVESITAGPTNEPDVLAVFRMKSPVSTITYRMNRVIKLLKRSLGPFFPGVRFVFTADKDTQEFRCAVPADWSPLDEFVFSKYLEALVCRYSHISLTTNRRVREPLLGT